MYIGRVVAGIWKRYTALLFLVQQLMRPWESPQDATLGTSSHETSHERLHVEAINVFVCGCVRPMKLHETSCMRLLGDHVEMTREAGPSAEHFIH